MLVGTLTILAVAQTGSLFSADAWNNVTFTAGEVKNPQRNLPISLALGTGVVILLYVLCNVIYLNVLPLDGSPTGATVLERGIKYATEDRVATAAIAQMGLGQGLMAIAIMISSFGCNNGLILSGARVYYAMAKDGLFFRSVAKLHPVYKTPYVSLMVQMVWTCILCISGSYGQLLDYIVFAVLVFYILTIAAVFILRRTHPNVDRPYRAIGYPVLPAIYIVMALFIDVVLLRYKPQYTWPGLIIVLLGIPVYFLWTRAQRPRARHNLLGETIGMADLLAKKPLDRLLNEAVETGEHSLKRTLGVFQLTALGVGAMIGAGIFVLSGLGAHYAGPGLMLSFVLSGLGCAFAGLCYAEFAAMIPLAGSAYTYAYATLGEIFAWIIGWDLTLEYAMGASTVSSGWSNHFIELLDVFHIQMPLWLAYDHWTGLRTARRCRAADGTGCGSQPGAGYAGIPEQSDGRSWRRSRRSWCSARTIC